MDPLFEVHFLNENGKLKALRIAAAFDLFYKTIEPFVPAGRERSLVRTHLEEACFFAKKAMANHEDNQDHSYDKLTALHNL